MKTPAHAHKDLIDVGKCKLRVCGDYRMCERYELKIDYIAMDQVCTRSQYQVNILLYGLVYLYIMCIVTR